MSGARIAILISFSGQGGVERMVSNLAMGLVEQGYNVDMLLIKATGEHLQNIPDQVRVIKLKAKHNLTCLPEVMEYLRTWKPEVMLAAKHRAIRMAALARLLTRTRHRLVGRLGTTVSGALVGQHMLKKFLWHLDMRLSYRMVDKLVCVSRGVAEDVLAITGLPTERVSVVNNPVLVPDLAQKAAQEVVHPWLRTRVFPVICAAGRLTRQKDFATLIDAVAQVNRHRECGLIILGEGKLRAQLERQVQERGLQDQVSMPGFVSNPYAWMARADLFVLSSRWEGSPNVLKEALALGIPVVSTDCPSGPREILAAGRYGALVPMGDATALAHAIEQTLKNPLPPEELKQAVAGYTVETSTRAYLQAMALAAAEVSPQ